MTYKQQLNEFIELVRAHESGEAITICNYCDNEVRRITDDYIDYCDECEIVVEGDTRIITNRE